MEHKHTNPSTARRQRKAVFSSCKICGACARYSYYGAIVCHSCKMFFKRNAGHRQTDLKCAQRNQCNIDVKTRHSCASCRLTKCFRNGMRIEMIRSPRSRNIIKHRRYSVDDTTITETRTLSATEHQYRIIQTSTSNPTELDRVTLTTDHWNRISNLTRCFDENIGYSFIVEHFIEEQNALPLKLRFKYASVHQFIREIVVHGQCVFEIHRNSVTLSEHERFLLRCNTIEYTTIMGGMFVLRQSKLLNNFAFCKCVEAIFQPLTMMYVKRIIDQFGSDDTLVKFIFAIVSFSTINLVVYRENVGVSTNIVKSLSSMQDEYTNLAWRYLLHKYDHRQSVNHFSVVLRCLLSVIEIISEVQKTEQFARIVDSVAKSNDQLRM